MTIRHTALGAAMLLAFSTAYAQNTAPTTPPASGTGSATERPMAPGATERPMAPGATERPMAPGATERSMTPGMGNAARPATNGDRATRDASANGEKERVEEMLKSVQARDQYQQALEKQGYRISSINSDKKDYLEYEIVKGDQSYEVQLDFDDGATKASKIDVTTNMWRADSTKQMMKDPNYKTAMPMTADPEGRYSDRRYMQGWENEKEQLEKALAPNMKVADYQSKLEQMGYKITSVNDKDKDYVEYEIVKGDHSYEVQIDLDDKTQMGKKVDVTSNVWEAESTERQKPGG